MTTKRFYFVMIGLNILTAILVVGVVFWGNGLIDAQAKKLQEVKTEARLIDQQQISLVQAKKDIEKYTELNSIAKSIVPQDKDQAKTVREISKLATESGIAIKDIRFQTSNLGQVVPKATTSTEGSDSAKTPATPPISQVKTIDGISGVYALELMIISQETQPTTYSDFIKFLEKLENNRRTAHVDKISIKPLNGGGAITFTLTLNAYVKP